MQDPDHIYHWRRLDALVTTSGQPSAAEFAEIHDLGVRNVINLAPHSHAKALPDEAATLAALGMRYIHIPVDFQNPTEADFQQFCAALAQTEGAPLHVHCAANYRVSAFFYRYRRQILGRDDPQISADLFEIWQIEGVWGEFIARAEAGGGA